MILAIDSASAACTAALLTIDGEVDRRAPRGDRPRPCRAADADGRRPARRPCPDADPGRGRPGQLHRPARRDRRRAWHGDRLVGAAVRVRQPRARRRAARPATARSAWRCSAGTANGSSRNMTAPDSTVRQPVDQHDPRRRRARDHRAAGRRQRRRGAGRARAAHGEALAILPHAARALALPPALRSLDPRPVYARAPDARPAVAA